MAYFALLTISKTIWYFNEPLKELLYGDMDIQEN
jgi:hypothetical protein